MEEKQPKKKSIGRYIVAAVMALIAVTALTLSVMLMVNSIRKHKTDPGESPTTVNALVPKTTGAAVMSAALDLWFTEAPYASEDLLTVTQLFTGDSFVPGFYTLYLTETQFISFDCSVDGFFDKYSDYSMPNDLSVPFFANFDATGYKLYLAYPSSHVTAADFFDESIGANRGLNDIEYGPGQINEPIFMLLKTEDTASLIYNTSYYWSYAGSMYLVTASPDGMSPENALNYGYTFPDYFTSIAAQGSYYNPLSDSYLMLGSLASSAGYDEGYDDGYEEGSSDGWQTGYDEGYTVGQIDAAADYDSGYDAGYYNGFEAGKAEIENSADTFGSLFFSILDAPFDVIRGAFNFEIFGINVASILLFFVSVAAIAFLLKVLLK